MAAHDDSAIVASPVGVPRTIRTDTIGKHTLRLVAVGKTFAGLLITAGKQKARIDGEDPDAVWRELKALVGKSSDAYFGFEGALTRFRSFFPDGFQSAHFEKSERDYSSLLDLTETTRANTQALNPRDNIDLQSFVWVVGEYREEWGHAE